VRRALLWTGVLVALGGPRTARADFKEVTLAAHPAYAVSYIEQRTAHGGGLAVDVGFGLSDALTLQASGIVTWQAADATKMQAAGVLSGFAALVGLSYTLDVIRLVPTFTLQVGAVGLRGDATYGSSAGAATVLKPATAFGIGLGFSLDYLLTRRVAIGVEVKYIAPVSDADRFPMYLYTGPRIVLHFNN
jgi:hypothetical protein